MSKIDSISHAQVVKGKIFQKQHNSSMHNSKFQYLEQHKEKKTTLKRSCNSYEKLDHDEKRCF